MERGIGDRAKVGVVVLFGKNAKITPTINILLNMMGGLKKEDLTEEEKQVLKTEFSERIKL